MWHYSYKFHILLKPTLEIQHFLNQIIAISVQVNESATLSGDTCVVIMLLLWSYLFKEDHCSVVLTNSRAGNYLAITFSLNEKQERLRKSGEKISLNEKQERIKNTIPTWRELFLKKESFQKLEINQDMKAIILWELQSNEIIMSSRLHKWTGITFAYVISY